MKPCKNCGSEMPEKRIELGYSSCVSCSNVETYGFVNIINHKTGNTVQPMPKDQAAAINRMGDRKRFGTVLKGGSKSDAYNPKNTKYKVSTLVIGSPKLFEKVGEEAMYLFETKGIDLAAAYIDKEVKDFIINKAQAFQLKQILTLLSTQ